MHKEGSDKKYMNKGKNEQMSDCVSKEARTKDKNKR